MGFKKKICVLIKQCSYDTAWYKGEEFIGTIHTVTDECFPPDYVVIDCKENKRGLYPMIRFEDAEVVTPSLIVKFRRWLDAEYKPQNIK